jgi:hypothetical protein
MMVAMGLLTSSALLVHLTGGLIESHFHFFVIVPLLTLYGDWSVFLLAIGYVAVHHGGRPIGSDRCIQPSPGLETAVEVGLDSCRLRARCKRHCASSLEGHGGASASGLADAATHY